jgi:hypothetical protein
MFDQIGRKKCGTGGQWGSATPSTVFPYWNDITLQNNGGCAWYTPPVNPLCNLDASWDGQATIRIMRLANLGDISTSQSQATSLSSGGAIQLQSTKYSAVFIATSTTIRPDAEDQYTNWVSIHSNHH